MGLGWQITILQPGPSHSNQRRVLRQSIGPQTVGSHDNIIEATVQLFMTELDAFRGSPKELIQVYVRQLLLSEIIDVTLCVDI
jgi:hypothetical protein